MGCISLFSETREPSQKLKDAPLLKCSQLWLPQQHSQSCPGRHPLPQLRSPISAPSAGGPEPPGPPVYSAAGRRLLACYEALPSAHSLNPTVPRNSIHSPGSKRKTRAQMENFPATITTRRTGYSPPPKVCSQRDPVGTGGTTRKGWGPPPLPWRQAASHPQAEHD